MVKSLYIYIPDQNVVLQQTKREISDSSAGSFVTKNGIDLLVKNYLVSYVDKPEYQPLEDDLSINVIKLKLVWENTAQNFRELILFIGEDNLIYYVEGETYNRVRVSFLFSNIVTNEGIPDSRFDYDPPPTAHVVENFLFSDIAVEEEVVE